MFQVYVLNVSAVLNVCCKCFIWMLHMFHWLYMYVANVRFKRMLEVFYLDVTYLAVVIHICYKYL
jgi:hypothetical protein